MFVYLLLFTIFIFLGTRWKGNYFPYSNGTLGIRDVMLDSDGYYDCVAMNKAGMNSARIYVGMLCEYVYLHVVKWLWSVSV